MTVQTTERLIIHQGNSATTAFPFEFPIPTGTLTVSIQDWATKEILEVLAPGSYIVTGLDNPEGGSVTYSPVGGPLPATRGLIIMRTVPFTQELDISPYGGFNPETVEKQLDAIVMQTQQLDEISQRSVRLPPGTTEEDLESLLSDVVRLASSADNIDTVAGHITEVDTVAGIDSEIVTVAGIAGNVVSVAGNSSNINAVAANASNINAVAGNATNINAVAANATNINAVNANKANIDTVAGISSAVSTVAANITDIQNAEENAAAAISARDAAEDYRDQAWAWSSTAKDVVVNDGVHTGYSAYHWALKAQDALANGLQATNITVTPAGNIQSTNAQAALQELDTEKVAKSGDTITGTLFFQSASPTIAFRKQAEGNLSSVNFQGADNITDWAIQHLADTDGTPKGFALSRRDAAGAFVDRPFEVAYTNGFITFGSAAGAKALGNFTIEKSFAGLILNSSSGSNEFRGSKSGLTHWLVRPGNDAGGSDFDILRYNDLGQFLDIVLSISRATGIITMPKIAFAPGGTGSVSRTLEGKGRDIMDVRDFLASDGSDLNNPSVNLGAKFTAALRILRDRGGGRLITPDNTLYASGIKLFSNCVIEGQSRAGSKIKAPTGTSTDIILGTDANEAADAYTYFDTSTFDLTKGSNKSGIRNLTLDGSYAAGTTSGPFVIWGYGTIVQDVTIINSGRHGMRTEWTDGSVPMEGTFENIIIDNSRFHGWLNKGPHDSFAKNVIIMDASQATDGGYYGLLANNGRYLNVHVWSRSTTTPRAGAAVWSAGNCEFVACHFEGQKKQIWHGGGQDRVIGCLIYAPFGGNSDTLVLFGSSDNQHIGCQYSIGQVGTNPNTYGLQFGYTGVPASGNIIIGGKFLGFSFGSPFNFANSSGLNSILSCRGYTTAGGATSFAGTVHATDEIDYVQGGTVINYRKPSAYAAYANDAAAATGGVPVGGLYKNSTSNALTVRTT